MIHQINVFGKTKVDEAIERIQDFSEIFKDDEGFFLAFSGGKDSVVIKKLAEMAGVKFDAHYQLTTVDPPELVRFIKEKHPDVSIDKSYWEKDGYYVKAGDQITMWNLIAEKHMPPTRLARYCCEALKEHGGVGRLTMTGVRWAESVKRKSNQGLVTVKTSKKTKKAFDEMGVSYRENASGGIILNQDNDKTREAVEYCYKQRKTVLNPIIDWTDSEVWEFIHDYKVDYCELYDKGKKRLGCIGCPMGTAQERELIEYPTYERAYKRAFEKMLLKGTQRNWSNAEEVYNWWVNG